MKDEYKESEQNKLSKQNMFKNITIGLSIIVLMVGFFFSFFQNNGDSDSDSNEQENDYDYQGQEKKTNEANNNVEVESDNNNQEEQEDEQENNNKDKPSHELAYGESGLIEYPDFEDEIFNKYAEKFGEETIRKAREITGELSLLMTEDNFNSDKWKEYSTPEFYKEIGKINSSGSMGSKKLLDRIDLMVKDTQAKNEIIYEMLINYDKTLYLFHTIFIVENGKPSVKDIELRWER